jgi:hypothetical protein
MFRASKFYFPIILIITSLACAVPGLTLPDTNAVSTTASEIIPETSTSLPTITASVTFTSTPTLIPLDRPNTETPTQTSIFTLTPSTGTPSGIASLSTPTTSSVTITVSVPTNCRMGPGKAYEIAGTLLVDEEATVLARDPSNQYWYIPNPDPGIEFCWVWGEYASFTGAYLALPVLTPMPTPTATTTPPPSLQFSAFERGMDKCNDSWWVKLEITNKSTLTLRSVSVEMLDTDTGVTKFVSSDGFIRREGCGSYFQTETLDPNKTFVISGPVFNYNPHGHTMRVFITVCTEKDQKGVCNTIKIGAKP